MNKTAPELRRPRQLQRRQPAPDPEGAGHTSGSPRRCVTPARRPTLARTRGDCRRPGSADARKERLTEQRRALPDQPGVYLFRDARGKRRLRRQGEVDPQAGRQPLLQPDDATARPTSRREVDHIEYLVVQTEAEALLTEQNFIKQYKPNFNIRLRDDKSYPYIAISLDEDFPRVYFTRERHRRDRAYFGPVLVGQARPAHARPARQGLPLPLLRGADARPPLRLAVPGLLHQALRGALRRLRLQGGVPRVDRRRDGVPAGRFKQIERDLERRMYFHAGEQDFEQATVERNRLQSVRALLERQRVADAGGRLDGRRRRGRRGDGGQRAGLPDPRRRAERPPVVLPRQRGGARRRRARRRSSSSSTTPARSRSRR